MESKVAPGLLLSMPDLVDPNFTRAVVLMVEHSDEGSFGLIVNQPSELEVTELLEQLDIEWNGAPEEVVWNGGPVTPSTGWVLHAPVGDPAASGLTLDEAGGATLAVAPGIALSTSESVLRDLAATPPSRLRFLLGYSGWGPGQLAAEMVRGSWLHAEATPELVFDTPADKMWEQALRSLGIEPETVVKGVGVH